MGWISDTITLVRDFANEGEVNAKWTDPKVILLLEKAFGLVTPEIFRNADGPNSVRLSIVTTSGTLIYALPPNVAEIIRLVKLSSDGRVEWRVDPRSRWNPAGVGLSIDNGQIRFGPTWNHNETLELWYIPTGEVKLMEGTLSADAQTTTALALTTVTTGAVDKRTNAYAGYMVSLTDVSANNLREDRIVASSAFAGGTGVTTLTVEPAFTITPAASNDTFEVRPVFGDVVQMAVALRTAIMILRAERMDKAIKFLEPEYASVMRELRLRAASKDQMVGQHFRGDTWGNDRFVNDAEDWRTQG